MRVTPYIRLMRLPDHYLGFGAVVAAGIYINSTEPWIFIWLAAALLASVSAFMANELVDSQDVDKTSWNTIHVAKRKLYSPKIAWILVAIFAVLSILIGALVYVWGAVAMTIVGLLYSVKPIRLKSRFGLDILSQELACWILPFAIPVYVVGKLEASVPLMLSLSLIWWALMLPYQLADIVADKKVGFQNTHTVLGIRGSLWFGLLLAGVGFVWVLVTDIWRYPVTVPFVIMAFMGICLYLFWLTVKSEKALVKNFIQYSKLLKPATQTYAVILFLWWLWR